VRGWARGLDLRVGVGFELGPAGDDELRRCQRQQPAAGFRLERAEIDRALNDLAAERVTHAEHGARAVALDDGARDVARDVLCEVRTELCQENAPDFLLGEVVAIAQLDMDPRPILRRRRERKKNRDDDCAGPSPDFQLRLLLLGRRVPVLLELIEDLVGTFLGNPEPVR
jgi:hypothetical protein